MRPQPSMVRCTEVRSVRSPSTTCAPSRRRASARSSSRRTKARTLCPLASRNSVRLRPMPPTAPAAPVTRIGLSCLWFAVMSLTLGYFKRRTGDAARALERTAGGTPGRLRSPGLLCIQPCTQDPEARPGRPVEALGALRPPPGCGGLSQSAIAVMKSSRYPTAHWRCEGQWVLKSNAGSSCVEMNGGSSRPRYGHPTGLSGPGRQGFRAGTNKR
jgi:hypothetical protein